MQRRPGLAVPPPSETLVNVPLPGLPSGPAYAPMPSVRAQPNALAAPSFTIGNKASNLLNIAAAPRSAGVVPPLLPISHEFVTTALAARNIHIAPVWERFIQAQGTSTTLTPEAARTLATLRQAIAIAFAARPVVELDAWLALNAQARLVARSDGLEDSRSATNAGGARSVNNLPPRRADVSRAIGEVIASYFSERSMLQRLDAHDDIRSAPLLSVFLQVMVHEIPGGHVPTSGVMHTQEMEGPTPGLAVINATFGHNEGVVNGGLVPTDTLYVSSDDTVQYIERSKTHRMVPNPQADGGLTKVSQPAIMRASMALTAEMARALAKVGRQLEAHFGGPVDVEWTIIDKTLYILQARHLVAPPARPASYVDTSGPAPVDKLPVGVIVAGGSYAREIAGPSNAIVADTLPAALERYLALADRSAVAAVVVSKNAPSTSHEASTFRAAGIAVFHGDAGAHLTQWLDAGSAAVACPQTHQLVRTDQAEEGQTLQESLTARGIIQAGQIDHTIAPLLSYVFPTVLRTPRESMAYLNDLSDASANALADDLARLSTEELLTNLRDPRLPIASWSFSALLQRAVTDLTPLLEVKTLREPAMRVASGLAVQAQAVNVGLQAGQPDAAYLAAVQWLRACLIQEPGGDALEADSVRSLKRAKAQRSAPLALTNVTPIAALYAESLERVALACGNVAVRDAWQLFAQALLSDGASVAAPALATLVHEMADAGVLTEWLRTHFAPTWQTTSGEGKRRAQACLATLLRAAGQGEFRAARQWSKQLSTSVSAMKRRLDEWSAPDNFHGLIPSLVELVGSVGEFATDQAVPSGALCGLVSKDPVLQGLMATRLHEVVEVIDASIKSLVGSQAYAKSPRMKAERWFDMLKPYARLCGAITRIAERPRVDEVAEMIDDVLVRTLDTIVKATPDDKLEALFVNPGLDAERYLIGIADCPDQSENMSFTLDLFFTVAHQNALQSLAILSSARMGDALADQVPAVWDVARAMVQVDKYIEHADARLHLLDLQPSSSRVELKYAIPLRGHGVLIDAQVNLGHQQRPTGGEIAFRMYGPTERCHRMERMLVFLGIAQHALGLSFKDGCEPAYDGKILAFTLRMDAQGLKPEALKQVSRTFGAMLDLSFIYADGSEHEFDADLAEEGLESLLDLFGDYGDVPDVNALPDSLFIRYPYFNGDALMHFTDSDRRRRIAEQTIQNASAIPVLFGSQLERCAEVLAEPAEPERGAKRPRLS